MFDVTNKDEILTIASRRLTYSRTICANAGNDASRRLADRMAQRWFTELGVDICGCSCLDNSLIDDVMNVEREGILHENLN